MEKILKLRAPEHDDLDKLYRWENDPTQWDNALCSAVVSRHILWSYLQNYDDDIFANGQVRFMIDVVGEETTTIGTVDLCDFSGRDRRAFLSIYIEEPYRGHSYGARALDAAKNIALQRYNLEQLAAIVAADNAASLSLFAKAGFVKSGTLRNWLSRGHARVDAILLQLLLQ
jgi:diamine N-acetyltransferase